MTYAYNLSGALIEQQYPSGRRVQNTLDQNGDLEMVKLLVTAGADRHGRDAQYDSTPRGWAETSIEVSNNPKCADVVAYFDTLT